MKRTKKRAADGADDSGALAEAELTALEADIVQLQVSMPIWGVILCYVKLR